MSARAASSWRSTRAGARAPGTASRRCAPGPAGRANTFERGLGTLEVALIGQRRDEDAGGDRPIELRRGEVGRLEHRARVPGGALQVAAAQQQPRPPGHAGGEERAVTGSAALDQAGLDRTDGLVEGIGPHERDRRLTNHGRSVGAGTGRGWRRTRGAPARSRPRPARSWRPLAWPPRRAPRAWPPVRPPPAQRLQARVERRRRAHLEHAGHQRQRLEQLGGLLVGRPQPRRRAIHDRHRVLDALGAPERVRKDERRAERHAVVVARDVERLAQMVLARRLPGRGLGDPELEQQPGALGRGRRLGQRAA